MCNRIRLLVQSGSLAPAIRHFETHDVVAMSLGTSLESLELHIRTQLDPEQIACALSLWGDDSYPRIYDRADEGFFISCPSLR